MGKVSSSNSQGVRVPKLRFPGFDETWELSRLSDISYYQTGKDIVPKSKYVSTENMLQNFAGMEPYKDEAVVSGIPFASGDVLIANIRPYLKKVWKADFAGCCSTDVLVLHSANINPDYLYYNIAREDFITHVMSGVKGSKMPRGDKTQILEYKVGVPTHKEQQKIASILSLLDNRIVKQRQLVEALKSYKRGLSTALFTRKIKVAKAGESQYPEWKKRPLGEVFSERTERARGDEKLLAVTINNGVQDRETLELKDNSSEDKTNYKVVHIGDLAYNSMRMWQGACGVSSYDGIVSPAYTVVFVVDPEMDYAPFWGYYFKEISMLHTFQRNSQGLTSDTWNLKYDKFSKIIVNAPCLEEQVRIATLIDHVSNAITVNEEVLDRLLDYKRGLLADMFI